MRKSVNKLTNHQLKFASDKVYPLTKIEVIQFFVSWFETCGTIQQNKQYTTPFASIDNQLHKITKGENYKGLPYVVLDYPRIGEKQFKVLFRTLFWWGNYISLNLFIPKQHIDPKVFATFQQTTDAYVLVTNDLWENDVYTAHYQHISTVNWNNITCEYLRLVKVMPIAHYTELAENITVYEAWLTDLFNTNLPKNHT